MSGWVGPSGAGGTDNNSSGVNVAGTTGVTCSMSSVTAGNLIVIGGIITIGSALTPTITDTSSNVTSWTSSTVVTNANGECNMVVAWGVATSTGACNPKITWNTGTTAFIDLYAGAFTTPGGTISQDGSPTEANAVDNGGNVANVVLPAGGGSGSNDLLINLVSFGGTESAVGGSWVLFGPNFGDGNAYAINAAGNLTPNITQSPSGGWMSSVFALQAAGAGPDLNVNLIN